MVGEGGAAGDGRGKPMPLIKTGKHTNFTFYNSITVLPCLFAFSANFAAPPNG